MHLQIGVARLRPLAAMLTRALRLQRLGITSRCKSLLLRGSQTSHGHVERAVAPGPDEGIACKLMEYQGRSSGRLRLTARSGRRLRIAGSRMVRPRGRDRGLRIATPIHASGDGRRSRGDARGGGSWAGAMALRLIDDRKSMRQIVLLRLACESEVDRESKVRDKGVIGALVGGLSTNMCDMAGEVER